MRILIMIAIVSGILFSTALSYKQAEIEKQIWQPIVCDGTHITVQVPHYFPEDELCRAILDKE